MTINQKKRVLGVIAVVLLVAAGGVYLQLRDVMHHSRHLTLYGNTDIREVELAFNDDGRIQRLAVQEGDRVHQGELLARLDPVRFKDAVAQAQGTLRGAQQVLARLTAGSRPEEILEAHADVVAARAAWRNAQITYQRQRTLAQEHYAPQQSRDNADQARKIAWANWERATQTVRLAVRGPRKEDIAAASAQVEADTATWALARRALADTGLYAPGNGVVENRILEVGDMANPKTPVLTVALDNPIWARTYVSERALGHLHLGMRATLVSDSFPGKAFTGWVGFISPTAEFTPKTVETTQLRTELVYRVRVYVCNPKSQLRLGMPVTVTIPLMGNPARTLPRPSCQP